MPKIIRKTVTINGKEFEFILDEYNNFHLGGVNTYEETCFGTIKTQEDRVKLGKFLIEIGSKLATPKKTKT